MIHADIAKIGLPSTASLKVDGLRVPASGRRTESAWYDAFAVGEHLHAVTIGNVAGGEAQAADLLFAIRSHLRRAADMSGSGALLRIAQGVFRPPAFATDAFASAIIGIVDCASRTFTYVSAGHAPPVIRYADGTVATLPAGGAAIGRAEFDQPSAEIVVHLGDAALLVLSSQVEVEAVASVDDAVERLRSVLADERVLHCDAPSTWIAQRVLDRRSHADAALLALKFATPQPRGVAAVAQAASPRWSASWSFDATGPASKGARRAFLACLAAKSDRAKAVDITAAELIFGELLGNVVRHAPGQVEITLDWTADDPVLHVRDNGPGFHSRRSRERLPTDDWSESGRGLFIVNACATKFTLCNRIGRGTHASATLPSAS